MYYITSAALTKGRAINSLTSNLTLVIRLSMLEDCASYLDGTIYNLEAKVTNFDDNQGVIQQMLTM